MTARAPPDTARVRALVRAGVLQAFGDREEPIVGFALCTDDDVVTLYHVECAEADCVGREPGWRFQPHEWTETRQQAPAITAAAAILREWGDLSIPEEEWGDHRDALFVAITQGLLDAKRESKSSADVFLSVMSTDPSAHMAQLGEAAVLKLNSTPVIREWRTWRRETVRRSLHHYENLPEPRSYAQEHAIATLTAELRELSELPDDDE